MAKITIDQLMSTYTLNDHLDEYADVVRRSRSPTGPVDVVLDTDTYNEIDDQYASSLAMAEHCTREMSFWSVTQWRLRRCAPFWNRQPPMG